MPESRRLVTHQTGLLHELVTAANSVAIAIASCRMNYVLNRSKENHCRLTWANAPSSATDSGRLPRLRTLELDSPAGRGTAPFARIPLAPA